MGVATATLLADAFAFRLLVVPGSMAQSGVQHSGMKEPDEKEKCIRQTKSSVGVLVETQSYHLDILLFFRLCTPETFGLHTGIWIRYTPFEYLLSF